MTALLLLANLIVAVPALIIRLRVMIRDPRRLRFLDRPAPRLRASPLPLRPEGPAPVPPLQGAGLPPRAATQHTGARRHLRRERGQHPADSLRIDLATTTTLPRVKTSDRPPWKSEPFPKVTP